MKMWPFIVGGTAYVIMETKLPELVCENKEPYFELVIKSPKQCNFNLYHVEGSDSSVSATASSVLGR